MILNIVIFKNGFYGIRKKTFIDWLFGLEGSFRDFHPISGIKWRRSTDSFFKDCQTDDKNKAWDLYNSLNGSVIKEVIK
jgi:hypothetical protein